MIGVIRKISGRIWCDILEFKWVIAAFSAYYILIHVFLHAFCPLVLITGFPCAGCGMTRAVFFMLTGQFARSFRLNPMALPVILFAVYCFIFRYIRGVKVKYWKAGILILLAGLIITYLYRMFTVFPMRPPYVYTSGSLFEKIIPHYREILHIVFGI